jgi:hypothetical protein
MGTPSLGQNPAKRLRVPLPGYSFALQFARNGEERLKYAELLGVANHFTVEVCERFATQKRDDLVQTLLKRDEVSFVGDNKECKQLCEACLRENGWDIL